MFGHNDQYTDKKDDSKAICPWQCGYCGYTEYCHGKSEIRWKTNRSGGQKPELVFNNTNK